MIFKNNIVLSFSYELSEIKSAALKIIHQAGDVKIWLFEGDMGAGKTTFIKEICKNLGVADTVTSPTFSLVNEYMTVNKELIYHFDFYRLSHETEALDIGADEYFFSGNLCLIEWAEKIPSLIPESCIKIRIEPENSNKRKVFLFK